MYCVYVSLADIPKKPLQKIALLTEQVGFNYLYAWWAIYPYQISGKIASDAFPGCVSSLL